MRHLLQRQWFLISLTLLLVVGWLGGERLLGVVRLVPRGGIVATVMFLSALTMEVSHLTSTLRRWQVVAYALLLNAVVAPPLAWLVGIWLPEPLAVGLLVAATVPCTLVSATVWTRRGGGNAALAMLVTLVTNLACFFVLPTWLWFFLRAEVPLDPWRLSLRIFWLVVVPVVGAQVLRLIPLVRQASMARKGSLSVLGQLGVLTMIFIGAVHAGETVRHASMGKLGLLVGVEVLLAVLAVHLVLFALGWWGTPLVGGEPTDRLAAGIAGSQKTLMIGLDVALVVSDLGYGGLTVLPMVAYHIAQLVIDTLLVDWLKTKSLPNR